MGHLNHQKTDQTEGNPLGSVSIVKLIGKFAIPSIISMLVNAAYNVTDQIFIGNVVGLLGNAATNVAFPVVILTIAFSQLVGVGTAANFNIRLGARQEEEARNFVSTGITLMFGTGILLMCAVVIFKSPILLLCGATDNVLSYAQRYLGITAFGIPFLLFSGAASHLIRADGSPLYSMTCTVTGAVLNVLLDGLFMFGLGWGVAGAATATVIGHAVSFLLCLFYFTRFKSFRIRPGMLGLQWKYVTGIAKLGVSNFINQIIMMLVNIVMNNTLKYYGGLSIYGSDIPLAVSGVVAKLNSILSSFSVGLAQGCQPILSFNMGAKNYRRVQKTYKTAVCFALAISMIAFLLFQLFPRQIIAVFGSGEELYFQFAERYMRVFMMMVCVFGIQPLSVNYFTGIGNMKQGVVLSLSRQGLFLIPMLLLLPLRFGLDGVLYAGPIADSLACALSLTLVFLSFRRMDRASQQQ